MNYTSESALPKHAPIRRNALTRSAIHVLVSSKSGGRAHMTSIIIVQLYRQVHYLTIDLKCSSVDNIR